MEEVEAAEAFQRLHPREFLERFITKSVRPDGRGLDQSRDVNISSGTVQTADGSGTVHIGRTSVCCGIKFMVGEPAIKAPDSGLLDISVSLLPVCSPEFDGRPSELSIALGAYVSKVVDSANLVDKTELLIKEGVACFVLRADIVCLSDDGNLWDACLLSFIAALSDLGLPNVDVVNVEGDKDKTQVVQIGTECPNKLQINNWPVSSTFGLFGDQLLLDPTNEEMRVLDGVLTVVLTENGDVACVQKTDGPSVSMSVLDACLDRGTTRAKEIGILLKGL
uniref:Ribosomal RNA-processing protein 43 n=1 Tax=Mucochytrium quahogii TaxID=96639 RepID=A0A7S2RP95_9STRA|mmetsp:Transcript_6955/g.11017  ORF Transcript_6955/g.11017 Transcript_6955/m.11017 type:complete len:279 (+) Transcript_6955:138-974(+)|eukprot:CAMPEP_0203754412 /NCGR_PEP_ID=MMETSP0098-20131031/8000_1 /ASSEMBLY_ACC=CAM_ASM_000208 /TAXON_ID=96639 /ORGANISM=" , Strain NY0313808BC1" /LENGTH=278 /DNA_ID=CAMNT_0050645395 /DNA_START=113 /DNA_END=949 /DNA_ORIENTATION=-